MEFSFFLERNIFGIHNDLKVKKYTPEPYRSFYVFDPKKRHIHSANIRDRVIQQAVFQKIEPYFDKFFIFDSYSSRKGTHAGFQRLEQFSRKVTKNYSQCGFVLKCDIRKFFDSIDHSILKSMIQNTIKDDKVFELIESIIDSFSVENGKGLPLGNVTSQLFGNIYMHVFDHFVKHTLKVKHYIRYCDDFVIVHKDRYYLETLIPKLENFLAKNLLLVLHSRKREIRKISQGVDFLGFVLLPHYSVLRTNTKRRIIRKFKRGLSDVQKQSYFGVMSHCKSHNIIKRLQIKSE